MIVCFFWTGDSLEKLREPEVTSTNINVQEQENKENTQEEEEEQLKTHSDNKRSSPSAQRRRRRVKTILFDPGPDNDRQLASVTEPAADLQSHSANSHPPGLPALPHVRCSSRLAAKPRQVHGLPSQQRHSSAQSEPSKRTDGPIGGSADSSDTSRTDAEWACAAERDPGWQPEVRERRHGCSSCDKKFYQISHLKKHQFSHTDEKPFTCQDCGKNYTSAESFRAHQVQSVFGVIVKKKYSQFY